jgi:predicted small metal-binding protein
VDYVQIDNDEYLDVYWLEQQGRDVEDAYLMWTNYVISCGHLLPGVGRFFAAAKIKKRVTIHIKMFHNRNGQREDAV